MQAPEDNTTQIFNQYRILLFSIAYRMLGSATDAEDIVQEAFLRWLQKRDDVEVQSARAYLSTIVVRLCIDQLRVAKTQREVYVGQWLPEPIETSSRPELVESAILAESLSFAFLLMLERLGPLERAVFLLREVFDYDYAEIAEIVNKSEANCRQVMHRAHQHLGEHRTRYEIPQQQQSVLTEQFMHATMGGDVQGLLNMLTDEIVFRVDTGGNMKGSLKPITDPDKVTRGMLGARRWFDQDMQTRIGEINGQPAIIGYVGDRIEGIALLDLEGEHVRNIYMIVNPDKLHWLQHNKTV